MVCDTEIEIIRFTQEKLKKLVSEKASIIEWIIEITAIIIEKLIAEFPENMDLLF